MIEIRNEHIYVLDYIPKDSVIFDADCNLFKLIADAHPFVLKDEYRNPEHGYFTLDDMKIHKQEYITLSKLGANVKVKNGKVIALKNIKKGKQLFRHYGTRLWFILNSLNETNPSTLVYYYIEMEILWMQRWDVFLYGKNIDCEEDEKILARTLKDDRLQIQNVQLMILKCANHIFSPPSPDFRKAIEIENGKKISYSSFKGNGKSS